MKITIITATMNAERVIRPMLMSVAAQTESCEHLIVDGGSTDKTREIVSEFTHATWIDAPGSSIFEAFNIGIKAATGARIVFLGSDDTLFDRGVIKSLSEIEDAADVLHCRVKFPYWPVRSDSTRMEAFAVKRGVFDVAGAFNTLNVYFADVEWQESLSGLGVTVEKTPITIALLAFGGVTCGKTP